MCVPQAQHLSSQDLRESRRSPRCSRGHRERVGARAPRRVVFSGRGAALVARFAAATADRVLPIVAFPPAPFSSLDDFCPFLFTECVNCEYDGDDRESSKHDKESGGTSSSMRLRTTRSQDFSLARRISPHTRADQELPQALASIESRGGLARSNAE